MEKKRASRFLSLMLAVCMVLSVACLPASAEEAETVIDGITYELDSSTMTAEVTWSEPNIVVADIPGTITGEDGQSYTVTSIGRSAFYSRTSLQRVTLPDTITTIGPSAFYNCSDLTSIDLPDSLQELGESGGGIFAKSGLTSLVIPDGITRLPESLCAHTNLTSVTIPDSVTEIGAGAFTNCDLTSVDLPDGLTVIDNDAFQYNRLTGIDLPDSLTAIGRYAFAYNALTSVTIPGSVSEIGGYAFEGCTSLRSVTIEEGVEVIGGGAFEHCSALTGITIPSSVREIGGYAFDDCNALARVDLPEGLETIGWRAFDRCPALTSITIPASVTAIEGGAFEDSGLVYAEFLGSTPPAEEQNTFSIDTPLYVPAGAVSSYEGDSSYAPFVILAQGSPLPELPELPEGPGQSEAGVSVSRTSLDFGTVTEGYDSVPSQSFTITNVGPRRDMVTLDFSNGHFHYENPTSNYLDPGESKTVSIAPSAYLQPGAYTEKLSIHSSGETVTVTLRITVTAEEEEAPDLSPILTASAECLGTDGTVAFSGEQYAVYLYPAGTELRPISSLADEFYMAYHIENYDPWMYPGATFYAVKDNIYVLGITLSDGTHRFQAVRGVDAQAQQPQPTFTDVTADKWYYDFVETVAEKKLFAGNGDGTFAPEANMTYAEFLAVLFQFSGDTLPTNSGPNWYDNHIQWAKDHDLIPAGMLNGFDPEAAITRQDMAALFGSFLTNYDYTAAPVNSGTPSFSDGASIADYARDGVELCYQLGIMGGNDDGTFAPGNTAIRAEVAVTMVQMARVMGR